MRKNHFAKLVTYMKNVYHLDRGLNKLSDGRVNPTYSTAQVILPVLLGFLLRIKSFNELNLMIKNNEFSKLVPRGTKLPQIDAIRDTLKVMDIDGLKQINHHIVKKVVENKVYENGTIDGYMVAAIDGTKFFGSNKKNCSECLKNTKDNKTHSFHSGAVMSTVGSGPKLVIGFEMYKPSTLASPPAKPLILVVFLRISKVYQIRSFSKAFVWPLALLKSEGKRG